MIIASIRIFSRGLKKSTPDSILDNSSYITNAKIFPLRRHGGEDLGSMGIEEFKNLAIKKIKIPPFIYLKPNPARGT